MDTDAHEVWRILVVDDNKDSADTLKMQLEREGHTVWSTYDGVSALALASKCLPEVILLDIVMPGVTGHEVARRLRAMPDLASTLIVAVTGWRKPPGPPSWTAGFDFQLDKPIDPGILAEWLKRAPRTGRPFLPPRNRP
jgi:CheY-like chemotaxis protein